MNGLQRGWSAQVGKALKLVRLRGELTLDEMAARLDATRESLERVEVGEEIPCLETLGRMLEELGIDLYDLDAALREVQARAGDLDRVGPEPDGGEQADVSEEELKAAEGGAVIAELLLALSVDVLAWGKGRLERREAGESSERDRDVHAGVETMERLGRALALRSAELVLWARLRAMGWEPPETGGHQEEAPDG